MINLQKLFRSIRLNPCDEFQAKQIKGMLAQLEVENPADAAIIAAAYEERKKMLCPVADVETNEAGDVETNEDQSPIEEALTEEVKTKKSKKSSQNIVN